MAVKKYLKRHYIYFALFAFVLGGCNMNQQSEEKTPGIEMEMTELDEEIFEDINDAKQVFYSLPSPLETAMLLKNAGATYSEELLNPLENVSNYQTNKSMALNLGIFSTDLSYASLYDQTQAAINYMTAAKKLADGLGILDAIDDNTIQRLEENVNNRDVIMDIISETFMSSNSFLRENDRPAIAAMVLVGGWMEGLYLAVGLVDVDNFEDSQLMERIVDQKFSLEIVIRLLEENSQDEDVNDIIVQMKELKVIYDKVQVSSTSLSTEKDEKTDVTTIKSKTKSNISKQVFLELSEKAQSIRNKFIS